MLKFKHGLIASVLNIANQLTRRLVGIVSLIILARVLTPEDFGLVAIALVFMNFVNIVTNTGSQSYLLSRNTTNDEQVLTGWTIDFVLKNISAILLAISSFFVAGYYEDERLTLIILVFSFQVFLESLKSPGLVYKYKYQEIGGITRWQICSRFITTGITISIAMIFESYWALVIGQLLVTISNLAGSYVMAPMKPKFTLDNFKPQWRFSKWIMPQSIVNFFRSQLDVIQVSLLFDKSSLGAYNSMRYYAYIPYTVLIEPVLNITLTQFSQFKSNDAYLRKQLQVLIFLTTSLLAPVVYIAYQFNSTIVAIVLGENWVEYASLLGIFSIFMFTNALNQIASQILMLNDATNLLLIYSVICVLGLICILWSFDFKDMYVLAELRVSLEISIAILFFCFSVYRFLGVRAIPYLLLPLVLPFSCAYIASSMMKMLPSLSNGVLSLLLQLFVFIFTYGISQAFLVVVLRRKIYCCSYLLLKLSR